MGPAPSLLGSFCKLPAPPPSHKKRRKIAAMKEELFTVSHRDMSHYVTNILSADMGSHDI